MPKQAANSIVKSGLPADAVPVVYVGANITDRKNRPIGNECGPELGFEIVAVPGVVVPRDVRQTAAGIGKSGQQAQESRIAARHQVPVFDIIVEDVAEQNEMLAAIGQIVQRGNKRPLLGALFPAAPSSEMYVSDKYVHTRAVLLSEQDTCDTRARNGRPDLLPLDLPIEVKWPVASQSSCARVRESA